ncbi:MAG: TIGR02996 domain-containing protein [Myxococcota bacterium]
MSIDEALLDAIRLDPSHWETWLVFADYLSEQGDARADLIRSGHRLALGPLPAGERDRLRSVIAELRRVHEPGWREGLKVPPNVTLRWRHGFVVGLTARGSAETALDFLRRLLPLPVALPFGALVLQHAWPAQAIAALATLDGIERLVSLDLAWTELGDAGVEALVEGHWTQLRELSLAVNGITAVGARHLQRGRFGALRGLDLHGNPLGPEGIGGIGGAALGPRLRSLDVAETKLGDSGVVELADAPAFRSIERLYLRSNRFGRGGAAALAKLTRLTRLNLASNPLGPGGGAVLAAAPWSTLESLSLFDNRLGDEGAVALGRTARWPALATLQLAKNDLGDVGARALARTHLPLRSLSLWANRIEGPGARALLDSSALDDLVSLDLRDNAIAPEDVEGLRRAQARRDRQFRLEL